MNNSLRKTIDHSNLTALIWDGNPQAIEVLYDQFGAVVYGIILRIVKEETTAEELLKQTFVYIWKNNAEFDASKQNLSLWVIGVACKIARKRMPFHSYSRAYARNHNGSYSVKHAETGELFEQRQADGTPSDICNLMTAEERGVLDLVFFGGGKIKEVADYLGMNETNVKQLLLTAVNHYRKERREVWK